MTILLVIIYLAFISLGLPDSLLGAAWPSMYAGMGASVSSAGIVSMIITGGTVVSSLLSDRLIRRLGASKVTAASVFITALALFGFSFSNNFWELCLWAVPYGLGAGSVDAALNNFVALHYKSRHMNWLHCFWGVGATVGPYIMGLCLTGGLGWPMGYRVIGFIQTALTAGLVLSLPLWKKAGNAEGESGQKKQKPLSIKGALALPGAGSVLATFFFYCALEASAGLWASSYMVLGRGMDPETAASWAALFYLGITGGRLLSGVVSERLGERRIVKAGLVTAAAGGALLLLPGWTVLPGLVLLGLGCAPVFPGLLHQTPENFGAEHSQTLMGMQMAVAYLGTTFMPPLLGLLTEKAGPGVYPIFLLTLGAGALLLSSRVNRLHKEGRMG